MKFFRPSKYRIVDQGSRGWATQKLMFGFWWMHADYGFNHCSEADAKASIRAKIELDKENDYRDANIKKPYEYP